MVRLPIALSAPDIGDEERRLVAQVLDTPNLACGPMLEQFERELARRFGTRHAIGVSSGTAGLHLSLIAAGAGESDFVLTSPLSFIASANVILYQRAVPVFIDVDPVTLMMDVDRTVDAIHRHSHDGRLKAVLPVHLFGQPMEMRAIVDAARERGVAVIEDASEATGATIDGRAAGSFGDSGVFAFYPNKQMTSGEGGVVITDRDDWASLLLRLRNHDAGRYAQLAYNYRIDEMSAALALAQLRRLDELLAKRKAVAERYLTMLADVDAVTPLAPTRPGAEMSWFAFVVRLRDGIDRDDLMLRLEARGVPTRPYFPAIHLQPLYRTRFGFEEGDFPHAEAASRSLLALPFHSNLGVDEVECVCDALVRELAAVGSVRVP